MVSGEFCGGVSPDTGKTLRKRLKSVTDFVNSPGFSSKNTLASEKYAILANRLESERLLKIGVGTTPENCCELSSENNLLCN